MGSEEGAILVLVDFVRRDFLVFEDGNRLLGISKINCELLRRRQRK